jgi:transposase
MTTTKSPSIKEHNKIYIILLQDLIKMGVCRHAMEMLSGTKNCQIIFLGLLL